MSSDYLMNIATGLYFVCYIPEFYANYRNKNANVYNVFEKIVMITATGFGLGYSISIQNITLIYNYAPLFALDTIALFMRVYYAYRNSGIGTCGIGTCGIGTCGIGTYGIGTCGIGTRVELPQQDTENPLHTYKL